MKNYLFLLTLLITTTVSFAQSDALYMPRNIMKAVENGTRTTTGEPGKNYWQNKGTYDIQVMLTPETKTISGTEEIVYENNSPNTLRSIAIRFVNNFHKIYAPRAGYANPGIITTGLDIQSFSIDKEAYNIDSKNWGTVEMIHLNKPIMPHTSITLNIQWSYPLSKISGREGQIDSTTFFAAYSYPRVSVYDDYYGWDMIPHTGRQEFYNDFNDYKLAVKVPKDYVVWATGDLLNPDEVLQPEIAGRIKKSYTSDAVIKIADADEIKNNKVTAQKEWNTWKFSTKDITDVCWGASKNYVWDAASVIVDAKTNRRASVQSAYNDTAKDFHHYTEWSQQSLKYFSTEWPGVPYPFSKMTSFQGYADMEYPMMINDNTTRDMKFSQFVQNHEIAHTYFPFYMGINETRYAYMDEGWATTFEYLIGQQEFGKEYAENLYKMFRISRYIQDPSAEEDQPIISMSTQVSGAGYGNNSYGKASLSYLALKDMLGDVVFKKALHHYMDLWHGKHPEPWDYFYSMSAGSGQNLNWFFTNWFMTNNYIDLKIKDVKKEKNDYVVTIENIGGFAIPFDIVIKDADGKETIMHKTPETWKSNQKMQTIRIPAGKNFASVKLDGGIFMDYTPGDNEWKK